MFLQKFYKIEMIINYGWYVSFVTRSSLSFFDMYVIGYIYYFLLLSNILQKYKAEKGRFY